MSDGGINRTLNGHLPANSMAAIKAELVESPSKNNNHETATVGVGNSAAIGLTPYQHRPPTADIVENKELRPPLSGSSTSSIGQSVMTDRMGNGQSGSAYGIQTGGIKRENIPIDNGYQNQLSSSAVIRPPPFNQMRTMVQGTPPLHTGQTQRFVPLNPNQQIRTTTANMMASSQPQPNVSAGGNVQYVLVTSQQPQQNPQSNESRRIQEECRKRARNVRMAAPFRSNHRNFATIVHTSRNPTILRVPRVRLVQPVSSNGLQSQPVASVSRTIVGGGGASVFPAPVRLPLMQPLRQPSTTYASSRPPSSGAPPDDPGPSASGANVATTTAASLSSAARPNGEDAQLQQVNKCAKFFRTLLTLANNGAQNARPDLAPTVHALVQAVISGTKSPEQFTGDLQTALRSAAQPHLLPFLQKTLPPLRQALINGSLQIEGIQVAPSPPQPPQQPMTIMAAPPQQQQTFQHQRMPMGAAPQQVQFMRSGELMTSPPPVGAQVQIGTAQPPHVQQQPGMVLQMQQQHSIQQPGSQPVGNTIYIQQPPMPTANMAPSSQLLINSSASGQTSTFTSSPNTQQPSSMGMTPSPQTSFANTQSPSIQQQMSSGKKQQMTKKPPRTTASQKTERTATPDKNATGASFKEPDDEINDVAAMGGVNLQEESQNILGPEQELLQSATRPLDRSREPEFLSDHVLLSRIRKRLGAECRDVPAEALLLISKGTKWRLKQLIERLNITAEHRMDALKLNPYYSVSGAGDLKQRLKFIEEVDRCEWQHSEERRKEMMIRISKSKHGSKGNDDEREAIRMKAKELQRVEQEELKNREANMAAQIALGGKKSNRKRAWQDEASTSEAPPGGDPFAHNPFERPLYGNVNTQSLRTQTLRPKVKRVNLRDLTQVLSLDRRMRKSPLFYRSLLGNSKRNSAHDTASTSSAAGV